ncbi:MAG: hypothetical protein KatS3mg111_2577 [Pirellulaceae bacterium]|nr:MAG: hypothetical protein KatS3mg111_2577 [Pirellulaceae bacterium]
MSLTGSRHTLLSGRAPVGTCLAAPPWTQLANGAVTQRLVLHERQAKQVAAERMLHRENVDHLHAITGNLRPQTGNIRAGLALQSLQPFLASPYNCGVLVA